jgi:oligopeptide transport system ATP-binding protein
MTPILSLHDLRIAYPDRDAAIEVVRGVSLAIAPSETLGVVGESGSGKTQVFMAAMGLLAGDAKISGSVLFEGNELLGSDARTLNRFRGSKLSMIFQDPMTSLTPHLAIGTQLAEVMVCHAGTPWSEAWSAARRMLECVGVPESARRLRQFPHELSGGMRQRVMIAMSLMCEPKLLIADEPTTALDVTVQAQIIELLRAMRAKFGMALALISHDLGVVASLADKILVMYAGGVVEYAGVADLLRRPRHPYTAELLKCIPRLSGPRLARLPSLAGQPPNSTEPSDACAFAPRCGRAQERCRTQRPQLQGPPEALVACHFPLSA